MTKTKCYFYIYQQSLIGITCEQYKNKQVLLDAWSVSLDAPELPTFINQQMVTSAAIEFQKTVLHTCEIQSELTDAEIFLLIETHALDWFGHRASELYLDYEWQATDRVRVVATKRETIHALPTMIQTSLRVMNVDVLAIAQFTAAFEKNTIVVYAHDQVILLVVATQGKYITSQLLQLNSIHSVIQWISKINLTIDRIFFAGDPDFVADELQHEMRIPVITEVRMNNVDNKTSLTSAELSRWIVALGLCGGCYHA
ncbi:MAG: hypothetical protein ACD_42C00603G0003 [uncultured bacterium]|nr:MAG: hypothetical protein ACD_42C00603G0003 [uncultured bacterium]OGT25613.1 MAG: hypothetical protein A3B71_06180 [Gammaproteobacteria bacterium RIFCSPHIGHO2_02_FULL_42_43]OGT51568.1 MAG: hypothetical protein A3E54_05945 [Gammaproteobacteria bacterium RIFCSPHIGHO2_12_FULL_41_25]OGT62267.1 MAG: hypothetical protein A3I77_04880 [Gammaproteobacteria bacterium RIFCSPLOWO2_02_FULL_42_14]OGT85941.1 MAG: hypothetical protein A3G86_04570 [Gammaproteobacteria bacterium RIFCSPLOWO2_12_FULL_42_18]